MEAYLKDKCDRMLLGERLIFSNDQLDELLPYRISDLIRSLPNPNRLGTKDTYVAWIDHKDIKKAKGPLFDLV
jgi:hypothetical protein